MSPQVAPDVSRFRGSRFSTGVAGVSLRAMTSRYEVTSEAVRGLLTAFWSPAGWRDKPDSAALQPARDAGLAFAEEREDTHDGWVDAATRAVRAVSLRDVSDAFVASLASRRLDRRSALGSFAVARHLEPHGYAGAGARRCRICGLYDESREDLTLLNFERFKWGGVRRDDIAYVAFDLEQFQRAPQDDLTAEAVAVGRSLVAAVRAAEPDATVVKLSSLLRMVTGNKQERGSLLEVLGVAGVLRTPRHPAYRQSFVAEEERELPSHHNVDTAYPACWWRGRDGLDDAALAEMLPALVS